LCLLSDSACFHFHFSISTLKWFQLVYQNPFYRVFRVCDRPQEHIDYGREMIFSPDAFAVDGALDCFDDSRTPEVLNRLRDANRLYQLAQQAVISEEWNMAEGLLQEALDRNPNFAMGYDFLGQIYERQDYLGLADQLYAKALVIQPRVYPALLHRAGLLRKQGYDREALSTLEDAVRRDPGFADGYYQLGIFSKSMGNDGRALEYIQKALELDPGFAAAFFQRGLLFEKKLQWDRARGDFLAAVDLDPENSHYMKYLHDLPARSIGAGEFEESQTP
jgi:tetratricopeptide (TPR) repeat protein